MFKVITGTLQANHISMQLTDDTINDDSIFEVYTDTKNIIPSSVSVGEHTVTITFDSKPSTNVGVKVLVNNIVGEYLPEVSASDVSYNDSTVDETLDNISDDISNISTTIDERVPDNTVLGGVLYHSNTGNIWKKLDASNLDYDTDSTIYSAMGNIDELETESKNLVDAINEVYENSSATIYDNKERMIGSWFGQPLYRKAYNFENKSLSSGTSNVLFSLPNVVPRKVNIIISNSAHTVYSQWEGSRDNNQILWDFSNGDFVLRTLTNWGSPNIYVIIEYTKVGA